MAVLTGPMSKDAATSLSKKAPIKERYKPSPVGGGVNGISQAEAAIRGMRYKPASTPSTVEQVTNGFKSNKIK